MKMKMMRTLDCLPVKVGRSWAMATAAKGMKEVVSGYTISEYNDPSYLLEFIPNVYCDIQLSNI